MASVNKVFILGNLGRDPEVRYTPANLAICTISVATTRKRDGNEEVEWHRIVFFDKLAEVVGEYMKKGSGIHVEGRLHTRKWQDKDGKDQYTTEIIGESMQMLGGPREGGGQQRQDSGSRGNERPPQSGRPQQRPTQRGQGQSRDPFSELDDDIPWTN